MRKLIITGIFSLFLSVNFVSAEAQNIKFPNGCKPLGFHYAEGKLFLAPVSASEHIQTIYLFHNHSMHAIDLVSEKLPDQDFAPQYAHKIEPDQWAAFALNSKHLQFLCSVKDGDISTAVSCAESIRICQYPRAKFADHNSGTYWLKSGSTLEEMVQIIAGDGILLRW